jgi:GH25 family lysozyme M1 (1,4-beta-N-acetylmuramidase)
MITIGLDISHHNPAQLDMDACRREGVQFIFIKSSEGSSYQDPAFAVNLAKARNAGMLVAAYHYVRGTASAAQQISLVTRTVPRDVPIIPDVEANSGGIALVREFVDRLRAAGYHVPLTYLPRWYWQQIGSPSLVGLPSLWSSRYPDNVVGTIEDELADVPASHWQGYGGLDVAVLQFTSSARVAGLQPFDANAYPGTRDELAAILGQATTVNPQPEEETEMASFALVKGDKDPAVYFVELGPQVKNPTTGEYCGAIRDYVSPERFELLRQVYKLYTVPQGTLDQITKVPGAK